MYSPIGKIISMMIDDHPQIDGESKSLRQCQVNPDLSTLEDTSQLILLHAMPGWKGNILEHVDQPVFIKNKHNFIFYPVFASFIMFHHISSHISHGFPMGFPWFSHGFCCHPVLSRLQKYATSRWPKRALDLLQASAGHQALQVLCHSYGKIHHL